MNKKQVNANTVLKVVASLFVSAALILLYLSSIVLKRENGLLVFGLDHNAGLITLGSSFDHKITFCNINLSPVTVSVVHACSCSDGTKIRRKIPPLSFANVDMHYHITDPDHGFINVKAIFKCALKNGKEVLYMTDSSYILK